MATEKIYEGTGIVVKAIVPQEHTEKLKKVTFKFFQDGKPAAADKLSEGSEFVKDYTAGDVGNGDEEDAIDGHDVIVHRVRAPKVPDDKDSYVLDYHLFYEVENGDGAIEKKQQLSVQQFAVFPRRARLKVVWDKDDKPFHNFQFKLMQGAAEAGDPLHTYSHDTENVDGEIVPAGSAEFNLGLTAGFQIGQHSPWEIIKEISGSNKRALEIRGDLAFRAVFLKPTAEGSIEQIVNYGVEEKGQTGLGHEVVIEMAIDPRDESALTIGNAVKEIHFRVTFGPEAGKKVDKSKRDDGGHPTKVVKADAADSVTITEKTAKRLYEGKTQIVDGIGRFKVCLGLAGGDTCKVEIAGSAKFLTNDKIEPDQTLSFENWRVVHYELVVPKTLQQKTLDASTHDFADSTLQQMESLSRTAFIHFVRQNTRIFDPVAQADHGTLGPPGFFDLKGSEGGPAYVLSGRNWRKPPQQLSWSSENPDKTLRIALCDLLLKWRQDTGDEQAGTKDFSGTLTEVSGVVDPQQRFGGLFMPFTGHDAGDCVTDVMWTADISKDDSVCKYTPALTIEEVRYDFTDEQELVVELASTAPAGAAELFFELDPASGRFTSSLSAGNVDKVRQLVDALLKDRRTLMAVDGKVVAKVSCSKETDRGEAACLANAKAKLQELFDAAAKPFCSHPALDKDDAPRTGSLSMSDITDRSASTMNEWHFQLPHVTPNGSPGPAAFIGPEKSKTCCPVKFEFSFRPHESSYGESDGKLIAWAVASTEGHKPLLRLVLQSLGAIDDKAGLAHGHGGADGKAGDCLEKADAPCEACVAFARARNLSVI